MAAYAALVTLSKAIHQLLPFEEHYSFLCAKHQMKSLHEKVIRFQVLLEGISGISSDDIDKLESRIRYVALRLEDIVESILVYSLAIEYENEVNSRLSIQEAASHLLIEAANSQLISSSGEENTQLSSVDKECENEVNSQLSIQEPNSEVISPIGEADTQLPLAAEGRAISRKSFFRGLVNKLCVPCCRRSTIKEDGSAEASTSPREDSLKMKKTLHGKGSLSILSSGAMDTKAVLEDDVNQTTGYEFTVPSTSAKPETETSLDDILGWCLDQDLESKEKYSHLPLTERDAAAFGNCIEEADLLLKEAMEMKKILDNKVVTPRTSVFSHNIATPISSGGAPDTNNSTVGLKDTLNQILDQITSGQRALEVIPIIGMGGIGKTTLARAVYDHHGKHDRFDLVLWATVSQQYDVKEILRMLCPENTGSEILMSVHQRLYGRRYLIILDDVWDEKVWDGVRNAFPNNKNCSRVILTTRLANVATYVSSSSTHAHQMQLLNEEQSWDLLRETVYGHKIGCPSEFEYYIGRRVSRNCKGLPLALVVIGGLLKLNKAKDHWEHVATSTTAEAATNDDCMLRILSLSYTNLPPHLKACFLYFGMFREDEEIPTKELVRLWCAEGFLKPRESKTMEEVAEECLEELVGRNLVLVSKKKKYNGKIKTSSIHDVLRELSLSQAGNEKFLYFHHGSSEIDNDTFLRIIKDQPRRVSFPYLNRDCRILYNSPIRTFRFESSIYPHQVSAVIPQFKLVRVLGALQFSSSAVINSVRLKNLRYLHLHKDWGDKESIMVPKSISKLRNLETLYVSCGDSPYQKYDLILPVEIWEMPRLRHLLVSEHVNIFLPPFPEEDSSTECLSLQTLTGLLNFGDFSPRVIQKLQQNLKKLKIEYKKISDGDEEKVFGLENFVNLHHLEHLTILSKYYFAPRVRNIGFPINLKKLSLVFTCLPWEKMESIGDLIHLQVLKLGEWSFEGEVWEPIEGGFPQLKYLKMEFLTLEEWRAESEHFPSLEKLVILQCYRLKEVPSEIGDIDTLEKLIVKRGDFFVDDQSVGASFEESVRRIEEEHQRVGNDSLQVIIMSRDQELKHVDR